jgi:hypothetical protein
VIPGGLARMRKTEDQGITFLKISSLSSEKGKIISRRKSVVSMPASLSSRNESDN